MSPDLSDLAIMVKFRGVRRAQLLVWLAEKLPLADRTRRALAQRALDGIQMRLPYREWEPLGLEYGLPEEDC